MGRRSTGALHMARIAGAPAGQRNIGMGPQDAGAGARRSSRRGARAEFSIRHEVDPVGRLAALRAFPWQSRCVRPVADTDAMRRGDCAGCGPPRMGEERAQATLEYALTIVALLAFVVGLACLWRAGERGVFVEAAERAASHQMDGLGVLDIALF